MATGYEHMTDQQFWAEVAVVLKPRTRRRDRGQACTVEAAL
jgi:hypothetical protein